MSIETEIQGSPSSIEGAATWLRGSLEPELTAAADAANGARRDAEMGWSSVAGDEFVGIASRIRNSSDDLAAAAKKMAGDLDDFAGKLKRSQDQMADVRSTARSAGLGVAGFVVQHPGDGPARPPDDFEGTTEEVDAHNRRVAAYNAHQDLLTAYHDAETEAARIDRYYATACRELQEEYLPGTHAAWILTLTDIVGASAAGVIGATIALERSKLLQSAQDLVDEATRAINDLQAHPERYMKRRWFFFQTLDEARLEADRLAIQGKLDEAEDLLRRADDVADSRALRYLGRAGKILGPLGLGLGVFNDWQEGETNTQIAVSQGVSAGLGAAAGFGASVGTAALIGAAAGSVVPGVGTAVGAVVGTVIGAGVAIFADGAIDSLFENGPDVGQAWDEGVDALADTGEAIADGVSSVGDTIGGWFS
ncbi:hypothetical protein SAMN05192575_101453 [Nocardioides alpinus]|uniref:Uncharacterized protein n=1 Tax=Nocardioides alpinus TaxID=748909 RepID=A0A1I0VTG3_9ACTN|nr:hypothetical protein [Nocardioides alpinus]PKH37471.1 hypothetical protein CXG46_18665 [Nocardioides alpinus]SFA79699.1 hypothetical protein SAMN05192575_101453 [Nocardioides alpinus]